MVRDSRGSAIVSNRGRNFIVAPPPRLPDKWFVKLPNSVHCERPSKERKKSIVKKVALIFCGFDSKPDNVYVSNVLYT